MKQKVIESDKPFKFSIDKAENDSFFEFLKKYELQSEALEAAALGQWNDENETRKARLHKQDR